MCPAACPRPVGFALAALTGGLTFNDAKPAALRNLVMTRVDPVLYGWSYDFVGDTAETASLLWPAPDATPAPPPSVAEAVEALHARGFEVAVETNGTQEPPPGLDWICVSPKAGAPLVQTSGQELKLVFPQPGLDPVRGLSERHVPAPPRGARAARCAAPPP